MKIVPVSSGEMKTIRLKEELKKQETVVDIKGITLLPLTNKLVYDKGYIKSSRCPK